KRRTGAPGPHTPPSSRPPDLARRSGTRDSAQAARRPSTARAARPLAQRRDPGDTSPTARAPSARDSSYSPPPAAPPAPPPTPPPTTPPTPPRARPQPPPPTDQGAPPTAAKSPPTPGDPPCQAAQQRTPARMTPAVPTPEPATDHSSKPPQIVEAPASISDAG